MSKKLADQPTTTSQPTNILVNLAGAIKQLTWAGFVALIDSLWVRKDSPSLTGSPTAPTQSTGDNSTKIATTAYADASAAAAAAAVVDAAPGALNTLKELADAINDDASYAATVTTALAGKQDKSALGADSAAAVHAATAKMTPADADELGVADSAESWALKKLTWGDIKTALNLVYAALTHAAQHKSGGTDAIKLDELAAPTDVTTLNATTSAHGLLPKLGGGTTNFLRADGTWAAPAGVGGVSASDPDVGYVASDGNDSTGDGSPGAPYLTAQAAYNAGFRAIRGGVGSFGDIACAGAAALSLTGVGKDKTIFGNITATAGFVFGNGSSMLSVNSIVYAPGDGAGGANGDPGTPGSNGDNGVGGTAATASQVVGIYCAGVIQLIGGAGGSGGAGADGDGSSINGGTGGSGGTGGNGADLSIKDSVVDGGCVSQGGNGGAGGAGGWGSTGTGGAGGSGGNGGGPGSLTLTNVVTPSVTVTAAAGGAGGAGGTGGATNGFAGGDGMASTDSTIAPRSATIAGTWFGGTYP